MDGGKDESPWRIRTAAERDREAVVMDAFDACLPCMERLPYPLLEDYCAFRLAE